MTQIDNTIMLQRPAARKLVKALGLPVNVLGSAFLGTAEPADAAVSTPEEPIPAEVLATLAAPALEAELRVIFGRKSLVRSWALASGAADDAAWLLAGYDDGVDSYTLRVLTDRGELLDTLVTWIEGNAGLWVPEMKFALPVAELAVWLAVVDLYSRAHYSAYLTHEAVGDRLWAEHIVRVYQDAATVEDPRWLLPFARPLLPKSACALSPDEVHSAAAALVRRGLLRKEEDSEGFSFSEPGLLLAESWHRRSCLIALKVAGADRDGKVGSHGGLFIRCDEPLWYCDIGADGNAVVCGADMLLTRRLLESLLTPEGAPALVGECYCTACGKPLSVSAKFCRYCGFRQAS
jgi:hypothetical protein